jgi:hypothetical protein
MDSGDGREMMSDPVISSIAAAVAGKAAEAALEGGKSAWAALVRLIRERSGRDKDVMTALEAARRAPEDTGAVAGLALMLERLAGDDADFGARIRELWPRAAAELSVREDGVVNSATGTVGGHLIQARDVRVEGGLHLGDVLRPDQRQ